MVPVVHLGVAKVVSVNLVSVVLYVRDKKSKDFVSCTIPWLGYSEPLSCRRCGCGWSTLSHKFALLLLFAFQEKKSKA